MPSYKLTYFNIRGRAETSRLMFAAAGVQYEDVRIQGPDWPKLKPSVPFGQLPMLEVDGKVIVQSHAIERYLARQFGFSGDGEWESALVDMIVECAEDYVRPLANIRVEQNEEKKGELKRKYVEEQVPQVLSNFEKILKSNNDGKTGHFVGNKLTLADICFYHATSNVVGFLGQEVPANWDNWPLLKNLRGNVENFPKIKEWIAKRPETPM